MIAATVTWPPIQMHAATMCTQRMSVGPETLSTQCYCQTKAPCCELLPLTAKHDTVEVECPHRVDGHFEAALGTEPTKPSLFIAIERGAYTGLTDGISQPLDVIVGGGCRCDGALRHLFISVRTKTARASAWRPAPYSAA
jgi:hypothetical protein